MNAPSPWNLISIVAICPDGHVAVNDPCEGVPLVNVLDELPDPSSSPP